MFLFYLIIIFVTVSVYFYNKFRRTLELAAALKGPPALPIIGNGLLFFNKSSTEIMKVLIDLSMTYGKMVRLWLGPELNVICSDPKDVEVILSSQKLIDKSDEYKYLKDWLGDGLLLSTGKKWHARRKIITPTFHFKILEQFLEIFEQQGDIFVEQLRKFKATDKVDIYPLVTLYALDVVCETAMGISANAQLNSESNYVLAVKDISDILYQRMFDIILRNNLVFKFSKRGAQQKHSLKILHDFTDQVIVSRRDELLATLNNNKDGIEQNTDDIGLKKKMAFLDVLLQASVDGNSLTNLEIREEVDTFMFEGHDTTTSGISFALYNLARYPDVQKKLYNELQNVLGDDLKKSITIGDLNSLHYLDIFLKESLRLFPSVPMMGRKLQEDTEINGKLLPAHTNVMIYVYFMNRDAAIFPEPEKFIPERFDVESTKEKLNPYAYVPFSAGPRNCIGQKFAQLEMKSIISKLVRNYEFSMPDGKDYEPDLIAPLILRPVNGLNLCIKPRTK